MRAAAALSTALSASAPGEGCGEEALLSAEEMRTSGSGGNLEVNLGNLEANLGHVEGTLEVDLEGTLEVDLENLENLEDLEENLEHLEDEKLEELLGDIDLPFPFDEIAYNRSALQLSVSTGLDEIHSLFSFMSMGQVWVTHRGEIQGVVTDRGLIEGALKEADR